MALIKCVECGQEYSDKAEACPKCACPTTAQITKEKVEEVEPEVIEEEEQTAKKERITLRKFLIRGVGVLFVIGNQGLYASISPFQLFFLGLENTSCFNFLESVTYLTSI